MSITCDEYFLDSMLIANIITIITKETVTAGVEYIGLNVMFDIVGMVILKTFTIIKVNNVLKTPCNILNRANLK